MIELIKKFKVIKWLVLLLWAPILAIVLLMATPLMIIKDDTSDLTAFIRQVIDLYNDKY